MTNVSLCYRPMASKDLHTPSLENIMGSRLSEGSVPQSRDAMAVRRAFGEIARSGHEQSPRRAEEGKDDRPAPPPQTADIGGRKEEDIEEEEVV